ncbi:unnamed protein product [Meganyctiphanes norvegica]|uniref:XK-related protein n=1 Tax=Meganyctiphanes norvegica TaxID=48144 RepID=A0AAV2QSG3_MEGNR
MWCPYYRTTRMTISVHEPESVVTSTPEVVKEESAAISCWKRCICKCSDTCWLVVLFWVIYNWYIKYCVLIRAANSWTFTVSDVTTDLLTALEFFNDGHWWWCTLAVIFAVFPNMFFNYKCRQDMLNKVTGHRRILVNLFYPIIWTIWFPWKAWRVWQKDNHPLINENISDKEPLNNNQNALLNTDEKSSSVMEDNAKDLIEMKAWESYLESTPELALQSRVIVQLISDQEEISAIKVTSAFLSLCSVSYSQAEWCATFHETDPLTIWKLTLGRVLTYFFVLGSRMYICGAAATIHPLLWIVAPLLGLMSYATVWPLRRRSNCRPACCKLPIHLQDSEVEPYYAVFMCGLRVVQINGTSGSGLYPSFSFLAVAVALVFVDHMNPLFTSAVQLALVGVIANLIMISPPLRRYGELINWAPTSR